MSIARNVLIPGAIAFALSVPIAINHDEAFLDHARSTVDGPGPFLREHVLGFMAGAALIGAGITAYALHRPEVGHRIAAGASGAVLGIIAGHYAWDAYLGHVEHQARA